MDYVPPLEAVSNMVGAGNTKGALPAKDLLIRGFLSGALLFYGALTMSGHGNEACGIAAKIAAIADAKTLGYAKFGGFGVLTAVVKAILCNWMVCLRVVMAMTSKSTIGKIVGAWLPIFIFFAQGFEHSIVNMFLI